MLFVKTKQSEWRGDNRDRGNYYADRRIDFGYGYGGRPFGYGWSGYGHDGPPSPGCRHPDTGGRNTPTGNDLLTVTRANISDTIVRLDSQNGGSTLFASYLVAGSII